MRGLPIWAWPAAGASAGVAVVAFLATPWPWSPVVVPALAAWTALLTALSGPQDRAWFVRWLLLVGLSAGALGVLVGALLSLVP